MVAIGATEVSAEQPHVEVEGKETIQPKRLELESKSVVFCGQI